jgi:hypothetical protein
MTEELILEWLNMVWEREPGTLLHKHIMLVLGSFYGDMSERVKAKLNNYSDLVILSGMTKLLQPLDVFINWPFKVTFWQLYN